MYEPMMTTSAPGLTRKRCKVDLPSESSSLSGSSPFARATSSPGTMRSSPPAAKFCIYHFAESGGKPIVLCPARQISEAKHCDRTTNVYLRN